MNSRVNTLPEIHTDNCLLRKIDTGDANAIYEIFSHPEVMRYWDHVAWTDISEASIFVQNAAAGLEDAVGGVNVRRGLPQGHGRWTRRAASL